MFDLILQAATCARGHDGRINQDGWMDRWMDKTDTFDRLGRLDKRIGIDRSIAGTDLSIYPTMSSFG